MKFLCGFAWGIEIVERRFIFTAARIHIFLIMWGISQATDLLSNRHEPTNDEINILLICPRDPRSILKTIANALVHNPSERIRFYVVEEHAHVLARHVLLLHAFFDESMPVRQRVQMYLEIFGNEKVTEKSANYVKEKARHLMDLVLDEKHLEGTEDVFDLSLLKQRDRDDLVSVFDSWRRSTTSESNDARDKLLRRFYGNRYDRCVVLCLLISSSFLHCYNHRSALHSHPTAASVWWIGIIILP